MCVIHGIRDIHAMHVVMLREIERRGEGEREGEVGFGFGV